MSRRKVYLPIEVVRSIIEPLFVKSVTDRKFIIDGLIGMLDDNSLEMFLSLTQKKSYKELNVGDYIKIKHTNVSKKFTDTYLLDKLEDNGLMKDGYLYGKILNDSSWHSNFNPYYPTMNIEMYVYDSSGKVAVADHENVNTLCIEHCSKLEIPYFSLQEIFKGESSKKT
tara:strand:- start:4239 stop:4745 length:507 start_codon:yes stop_codon:yes gene_type:complete